MQCAARRLDAADESIGVVVLRDVTELHRLEGVRRDFVANVSHELRTPLTSIRALVETLETGAIDDETVAADFLARIIAEVDRLAALVDDLLDLARLESGRLRLSLQRVEPEALVRRVAERMAPQTERARLKLELDVDTETTAIVADRNRIDQVLLNLVHNAVKFTPVGGNDHDFCCARWGVLSNSGSRTPESASAPMTCRGSLSDSIKWIVRDGHKARVLDWRSPSTSSRRTAVQSGPNQISIREPCLSFDCRWPVQ